MFTTIQSQTACCLPRPSDRPQRKPDERFSFPRSLYVDRIPRRSPKSPDFGLPSQPLSVFLPLPPFNFPQSTYSFFFDPRNEPCTRRVYHPRMGTLSPKNLLSFPFNNHQSRISNPTIRSLFVFFRGTNHVPRFPLPPSSSPGLPPLFPQSSISIIFSSTSFINLIPFICVDLW